MLKRLKPVWEKIKTRLPAWEKVKERLPTQEQVRNHGPHVGGGFIVGLLFGLLFGGSGLSAEDEEHIAELEKDASAFRSLQPRYEALTKELNKAYDEIKAKDADRASLKVRLVRLQKGTEVIDDRGSDVPQRIFGDTAVSQEAREEAVRLWRAARDTEITRWAVGDVKLARDVAALIVKHTGWKAASNDSRDFPTVVIQSKGRAKK